MAYNGSGVYSLYTPGNPVVTGTTISSTWANNTLSDIATGLSTCVLKDGTQTTTVRVPFAAGISSTLVTDATSTTTGSITTAGGISAQKAIYAGGAIISTLSGDDRGIRSVPATATSAAVFGAINTGGTLSIGLDSSAAAFGTAGNYGTVIYRPNATGFAISRTSSVDIKIETTGQVSIGTGTYDSTGSNQLYSLGGASTGALLIKNSAGNSANTGSVWNAATSTDNKFLSFGTEGTFTERGSIDYNRGGGAVRYNTTSDYRSKELYGKFESSGQLIDGAPVHLGLMKGAWIKRPMFVAHELQEFAPWAVSGEKDGVNKDGAPVFQQVDHQSLVPILWAEIQSLRGRLSALEAK